MQREGGGMPAMAMQHCTDPSIDKEMRTNFGNLQQSCSKNETVKTATGYVTDSVCNFSGMTSTSHAEVSGDFNSAYTVKVKSHTEGGPVGARDSTMTIDAKWVGACKPDQKPGDVVMPGGIKMNVKDLAALKNMMKK
jgi:hypothetical protein